MNPRIKELFQMSTEYTEAQDDGSLSQVKLNNICAEKFGELIVKECLTICEELGDKGMDGHYCADEISKKFRS
jgi:hypothetical protein